MQFCGGERDLAERIDLSCGGSAADEDDKSVDLPRGVRRKELTSEKKCPAAMKERKKDYRTSKIGSPL